MIQPRTRYERRSRPGAGLPRLPGASPGGARTPGMDMRMGMCKRLERDGPEVGPGRGRGAGRKTANS